MVRDKIYKKILLTLDKHNRFDNTDFKVESNQDNKGISLVITYIIEPKYRLAFKMPTAPAYDKDSYQSYYLFTGTACPGPLAYEEVFSFRDEDGIYQKISVWLEGIWEELSANPVIKQIESQQQQIDEIVERFDNVEDGFFTINQAEELKSRLDELESQLRAEIEKNTKDKKIVEQEISKLHTDIETLKDTIVSLKKKNWIKSFTGKVFKWSKNSENRKLLKDGYSVVREFLPQHIKDTLPDVTSEIQK